jgi:catechol 2,3-dioxygenase-like lactoylglutathione lyase family enzyme
MQIDQIGTSCTDLDQAQAFYCDVLGLSLADEIPGMAKLFGCEGVNIIMFKGDTIAPASVIYFKVEGVAGKIQEKVERLRQAGVTIEHEAKCIAPNWHGKDVYLAFFRDPFGNLLGLKSDVPSS